MTRYWTRWTSDLTENGHFYTVRDSKVQFGSGPLVAVLNYILPKQDSCFLASEDKCRLNNKQM